MNKTSAPMESTLPITWNEHLSKYQVYQNDRLRDANNDDYEAMLSPFIEYLDSLIKSGKKYWTYVSIGCNCGDMDNLKYTQATQIFPGMEYPPDAQPLILCIDQYGHYKKDIIFNQFDPNIVKPFDILWIDTYRPLLEKFREFMIFNQQMNGATICMNFAKYKIMKNPSFINLISLFYSDDDEADVLKNKSLGSVFFKYTTYDHQKTILKKKAMYLDWIGYYKLRSKGLELSKENENPDNILVLYGSNNNYLKRNINKNSRIVKSITEINCLPEQTSDRIYFRSHAFVFDVCE